SPEYPFPDTGRTLSCPAPTLLATPAPHPLPVPARSLRPDTDSQSRSLAGFPALQLKTRSATCNPSFPFCSPLLNEIDLPKPVALFALYPVNHKPHHDNRQQPCHTPW